MIASALGAVGPVAYFLARIEGLLGLHDQALAHARAAVDLCARGDFGPWLARSRLALAETLVLRDSRGDREAARKAAGMAAVTARTLGMRAATRPGADARRPSRRPTATHGPSARDRSPRRDRVPRIVRSPSRSACRSGPSRPTSRTFSPSSASTRAPRSPPGPSRKPVRSERTDERTGRYVGAIPVPPSVDSTMAGRQPSCYGLARERHEPTRQSRGRRTGCGVGSTSSTSATSRRASTSRRRLRRARHRAVRAGRARAGQWARASARGRGVAAGAVSRSSDDDPGGGLRRRARSSPGF